MVLKAEIEIKELGCEPVYRWIGPFEAEDADDLRYVLEERGDTVMQIRGFGDPYNCEHCRNNTCTHQEIG